MRHNAHSSQRPAMHCGMCNKCGAIISTWAISSHCKALRGTAFSRCCLFMTNDQTEPVQPDRHCGDQDRCPAPAAVRVTAMSMGGLRHPGATHGGTKLTGDVPGYPATNYSPKACHYLVTDQTV